MSSRAVFVLFDLGETLVNLGDLVVCLADRIRIEHPELADLADEIARVWIRRTSVSLPREEGAPFIREIDVAVSVLRELFAAEGLSISGDQAENILRRSWDNFEERVRFCPGVTRFWLEELLGTVAGMGIVTDGDTVNVDRLARRLRLSEFFGAIITSEAVGAYKPNPRIYRAGLEALGAEANRSIFVSDTALDLRGAAAVGMRTALLPRELLSERAGLPQRTFVLSAPRELSEILRADPR